MPSEDKVSKILDGSTEVSITETGELTDKQDPRAKTKFKPQTWW